MVLGSEVLFMDILFSDVELLQVPFVFFYHEDLDCGTYKVMIHWYFFHNYLIKTTPFSEKVMQCYAQRFYFEKISFMLYSTYLFLKFKSNSHTSVCSRGTLQCFPF